MTIPGMGLPTDTAISSAGVIGAGKLIDWLTLHTWNECAPRAVCLVGTVPRLATILDAAATRAKQRTTRSPVTTKDAGATRRQTVKSHPRDRFPQRFPSVKVDRVEADPPKVSANH